MEEQLLKPAPARVLVYLDPVSPYAWLGLHELGRIEAAGAVPVIVPVLFAGLLAAHGNLGPAEIPAKRRYVFRDVMREAERRGLRFVGPPGHPFNPLLALRVATAAPDEAARRRLLAALTCACWEEGADIADADTVRRIADTSGCDGAALLAAAQEQSTKATLASATAKAVEDGVFGVPTWRIEGDAELFWGADRTDALLWRLHGHAIDEASLAAFLARPPAAVRGVRVRF
jgi:2-hydroxychromene-2-carboxylate isomerase